MNKIILKLIFFLIYTTLSNADSTTIDHNNEISLLEQSCNDGHSMSCHNLIILSDRYKMELPQDKRLDFHQKACQGNIKESCIALWKLYHGEKKYTQALFFIEKSCNLGDIRSCTYAGETYLKDDTIPHDPLKAIEFYTQGCNSKEGAYNCLMLGVMNHEGTGIPKNNIQAIKYLNQACSSNREYRACSLLGLIYAEENNYSKAKELYAKACQYGDEKGCMFLGNLYLSGKGVERSLGEFMRYYEKACDGKNGQDACYTLASMQISDTNSEMRDITIFKLLEKSCSGGNAKGCLVLSFIYQNGYMISRDFLNTLESLSIQLQQNSSLNDFNFTKDKYKMTSVVSSNKEKAHSFLQQSCNLKSSLGCKLYNKEIIF